MKKKLREDAKPDADKTAKAEDKSEQEPANPEEKAKAQDARAARAGKSESVQRAD